MPDFKAALGLVLKYEGGKVDDPRDPGGRTAYGVTQATFNAYCKGCGATPRDVWTVTPAEVEAIYRDRYASAIRFDDLPDGIGFATLDAAINSGPKRAAQWLQAAVGVPQDGQIGPATIAAARAKPALTVIGDLCDARLSFLRDLPGWERYGRGWSARVEDVRKNATAMARAARPPVPVSASVPTAPPAHADVAKVTPPPAGLGARLRFLVTGRA